MPFYCDVDGEWTGAEEVGSRRNDVFVHPELDFKRASAALAAAIFISRST
jgi:hypothetical protein